MPQNPLCVYATTDEEEAAIIASWLGEQGIDTLAPENQESEASILGINTISSPGIEVCVRNEADLEKARTLLAEHHEGLKQKLAANSTGAHISVTCEKCNEVTTFPDSKAGTVQECENCGEYVDVPEV